MFRPSNSTHSFCIGTIVKSYYKEASHFQHFNCVNYVAEIQAQLGLSFVLHLIKIYHGILAIDVYLSIHEQVHNSSTQMEGLVRQQ